MNLSLTHCYSTEEDPAPADFIDRFESVGSKLQALRPQGNVQPSSYLSLVLSIGLSRPAALLIVEGPDGALARAGVFQGPASKRSGVIGLYETAPDPEGGHAAKLLMEGVMKWAVANDLEEIFAPVDVNTWFKYRVMLYPEETASLPNPFSWEPTTPPEHQRHFIDQGFEVAASFETIGLHIPDTGEYTFGDLLTRTQSGYNTAVASGLQIERLTSENVQAVVPELHALCTDAFADNFLFEPIPLQAFQALYGNALATVPGHFTFLARNQEDRLVGFLFTFPDRDWLVIKTIAVAPDMRGRKLGTALTHAAYRDAGQAGFRRFITALVHEDNVSRFLLDPQKMPGVETWTRRYELLSKRIPYSASLTGKPMALVNPTDEKL